MVVCVLTSLLRPLLVEVGLATVDRSDAVAVARLPIANALSCCMLRWWRGDIQLDAR